MCKRTKNSETVKELFWCMWNEKRNKKRKLLSCADVKKTKKSFQISEKNPSVKATDECQVIFIYLLIREIEFDDETTS